jgi:uncharacterized cupredoxin-like copper-binding protein
MTTPGFGPARRALLCALGAAALLLLAGCGPANAVNIAYNGFTIQASRTTVHPGPVVFNINNQNGQVPHEFLVVKTDTPADQLPLGSQSKVDESSLTIVGKVAQIDLGQSSTLTVPLPPGHYVLMCNLLGHYQLGMHADFIVAP